MTEISVTRCIGLWTGQNPLTDKASSGAMLEMDNVMVVRPDLIEYRPGFRRDESAAPLVVDGNRPFALYPFDGDLLVYSHDESDGNHRLDWASNAAETPVAITGAPSLGRFALHPWSPPRATSHRRNLYLTGSKGVIKLTSAGDTSLTRCGLLRPTLRSHSQVSGTLVDNGFSYAHRIVARRVDENGVTARSAPSISSARSRSASGAVDPVYEVRIEQLVAGDVLELYRTKLRSGTAAADRAALGAEFWLAQEYTISSADVSAGYATLTDTTPDTELGAALYTNPSRDGALKENGLPPAAVDIGLYRGCLWFANTRPQQSMVRVLVDKATDSGLHYTQHSSLDVSSGNATITGFADTDDIHVGMAISSDPGLPTDAVRFPPESRVVSKTASTVTMSELATSNGVGVTYYFHDIVRVAMGATEFDTADPDIEVFASNSTNVTAGVARFDTSSDVRVTAREIARAIALAYEDSGGASRVRASSFSEDAFGVAPGTLLIEEVHVGTMSATSTEFVELEFACTAPTAFASQPAWAHAINDPEIAPSSYHTVVEDERNVLRYTKPDEPEHCPPVNVIRIGSASHHILRIVPLEDALLILKEDGIYALRGEAPDSWSVVTLDPKLRLLSCSAVDVIDNRAYAWTDRGVVVVTETSVSLLSEPVVGMDHAADSLLVRRQGYVIGNELGGTFVVAWPTRGLVCLAVPAQDGIDRSAVWWVYALATGAWSRFRIESRCAAFDHARNLLFIERGREDFFEIRRERNAYTYEDSQDQPLEFPVTVLSASTFSVDFDDIDRWAPELGALVEIVSQGSGQSTIVDTDTEEDSFTVTVSPPAFTLNQGYFPGPATLRVEELIEAVIGWRPVNVGAARVGGLFREAALIFGELSADDEQESWPAFFSAKTDVIATPQETEISIPNPAPGLIHFARCWPKRAVARCAQLFPRARIRSLARWVLQGVTLEVEPTSERTRR